MFRRQTFSPNKAFFLIIVLALLIRGVLLLAVIEHPERAVRRDSKSYLTVAGNVLQGNGFSLQEDPPFSPSALRTPTYPLFLAPILALTGENPAAVAAVQILIDTATVLLIYFLGRLLFTEPAALLASFLLATSMVVIAHALFILTETLFTFLIVGASLATMLYRTNHQLRWLAASGLLSGLAILCRPIGFFFPLVILISLIIIERNRLRSVFAPALIYLFLTGITLAPWLIHNMRALDRPTLTTISSRNLLIYNAASLVANQMGSGQDEVRREMIIQADEELNRLSLAGNEIQEADLYSRLGWEIIKNDPARYIFIHLKESLNSLLPAAADFLELLGVTSGAKGTLSVLNQNGLGAAISHYFEDQVWLVLPLTPLILMLGITYAGALFGVIRLISLQRWFSLAMLLLPVLFFIFLSGPAANPRFRVPAMPYLCLLAGLGGAAIYQTARSRLKGRSEAARQ